MRIRALALLGTLNLACHLGDPPPFICRSDSAQFGLAPMELDLGTVEDASLSFDRKNRVLHVVGPTVTLSAGNVFGILSFTVHDKDKGFRLTKVEPKAPPKETNQQIQIKSMALSDDQVVLGGQLVGGSNGAVLLVGSAPMSPMTAFSVVMVRDSGSCSSVWVRARAGAAVCGGELFAWSDGGTAQPQPKKRLLLSRPGPTGGEPVTLQFVTSDGTQLAAGGGRGVICYGRMDSEAPVQCGQVAAAKDVFFHGGWINESGAIHMVGTQGTIVRREAGEMAPWSTYEVPADRGSWSYKKIGALGPCQPLIVGQDSLQAHGILLRQTTSGTWEQEQLPADDLTDFAGDDRDVFLLGVRNNTPLLWHRPEPLSVSGRTDAQRTL